MQDLIRQQIWHPHHCRNDLALHGEKMVAVFWQVVMVVTNGVGVFVLVLVLVREVMKGGVDRILEGLGKVLAVREHHFLRLIMILRVLYVFY